MGLLGSASPWAQTSAPTTVNRQADFIVAVVNSEPITNRDVQVLRQRLANEAAARGGSRPDAGALNRLALEQLINEKAQMQQAR
jgi:peptidyl-prolyl cis-trans isomerase SurA